MSSPLVYILSILAGLALGVISNWLYDIFEDSLFPENPKLKHIIIAIIIMAPFLFVVVWAEMIKPPSASTIALRIAECEETHGLSSASESSSDSITGQMMFESCSWPPPDYADPDGYAAINAQRVDGPEANKDIPMVQLTAPFADLIESPCEVVRLQYGFGAQGEYGYLPSIVVPAGRTVDIWGNYDVVDYQGNDLVSAINFDLAPNMDDVIILVPNGFVLLSAECES